MKAVKKKIPAVLLAGPLPPPAGGISIHMDRLSDLLKTEFRIDIIDESIEGKKEIFNIRSFNLFSYLYKIIHADIFYIHSGNSLLKKIHILTGKLLNRNIIITIHGYSKKKSLIQRKIDQTIFNLADRIIIVNEDIHQKLKLKTHKTIIKHAFIPPNLTQEAELSFELRKKIENSKANKSIIICANASRLEMHNNGDLYGLDMCIEATRRLDKKGINILFIYTVSSSDYDDPMLLEAKKKIKVNELEHSFLLLNENLSFVKLIEHADIVTRPTNTDGDSLTIREALFLNKRVIASDVVKRPNRTILFKSRDIDDFTQKLENEIISIQSKSGEPENKIDNITQVNTELEFYVNTLQSILN